MHRDKDMGYRLKKLHEVQYLKLITLRELLHIQTLQPKMCLKWINELQSDSGHILPIVTNYKVIQHTLTYRMKILCMIIHITYSPTY